MDYSNDQELVDFEDICFDDMPSITSNASTHLHKSWVIHINSKSIMPHIDELRPTCRGSMPSVIAITETWLDESVADSEVTISNYSVHRLEIQL